MLLALTQRDRPPVGVCLAAAHLLLRTAGMPRVLAIMAGATAAHNFSRISDAVHVRHAILRAKRAHPGWCTCLELAIIGYLVAVRNGIDARFVVGVKTFDFGMHAWVETNHSAWIGGEDDDTTRYVPVLILDRAGGIRSAHGLSHRFADREDVNP